MKGKAIEHKQWQYPLNLPFYWEKDVFVQVGIKFSSNALLEKNGYFTNILGNLCHHSLVIVPIFGNCTKSLVIVPKVLVHLPKLLVQLPKLWYNYQSLWYNYQNLVQLPTSGGTGCTKILVK